MPGASVYNILNVISKYAKTKPQYFLILFTICLTLVIFLKKIIMIDKKKYFMIALPVIIALGSLMILSTFFYALGIQDNMGYISSLNSVFNSQGSRNFIAIILLILFIIFVYEFPIYGDDQPHLLFKKITDQLGLDPIITNKTAGIIIILFFGLFTAYGIMITTNQS